MPLPPVVVELPQDAAPREAAVLIEACSRSLPERGCRLSTRERDSEPRGGVALVRRRGDRTIVIELGVRRDREVRWVLRELDFRPDDPPEERWRAAGLVIGTLVGQAEREAQSEPPVKAPPPPTPLAPRGSAPTEPPEREWKAELGIDGITGPALERGAWRFGAGLAAGYRLGHSPALVQLDLRYAARAADAGGLSLNFASAAIEAGVEADVSRPLKLRSSAGVVVERLGASIQSPESGATDSGARFAPGGRVGFGFVFLPAEFIGILAGAEGSVLASPTRLRIAGEDAGRAQNPTFALSFGLRFRWF
jgi:hypothetical protein